MKTLPEKLEKLKELSNDLAETQGAFAHVLKTINLIRTQMGKAPFLIEGEQTQPQGPKPFTGFLTDKEKANQYQEPPATLEGAMRTIKGEPIIGENLAGRF